MTTSTLAEYKNQTEDKKPPSMGLIETFGLMKKMLCDTSRIPAEKMPEVKPDFLDFMKKSEHMKFIWFGHSTLLLNLDDHTILIDPVFHNASPVSFIGKRFQKPVVELSELPPVDSIVISHDHYDHLDKLTVEYFRTKETKFYVPKGVGAHLEDWGIPQERITELSWHESAMSGPIVFTATPAQHFSGRGLFDRNETLWASWVIQGVTEKIYYSGDTGYGPHFKEIGEKYGPFEYAFIENGQYNVRWPDVHMQPEESLQAYVDLDAHTFIPVHWGMFDLSLHHWTEPIVRTHTIAMNWDIPIITPRLGETVDWFHSPNTPWWTKFIPAEIKKEENHDQNNFYPAVSIESPRPR